MKTLTAILAVILSIGLQSQTRTRAQNQYDPSTFTYTSSFSVYSANGFSLEYTSGTYSGLLSIQIAEVDGDNAHELICNLTRSNDEIDTFVLTHQ